MSSCSVKDLITHATKAVALMYKTALNDYTESNFKLLLSTVLTAF